MSLDSALTGLESSLQSTSLMLEGKIEVNDVLYLQLVQSLPQQERLQLAPLFGYIYYHALNRQSH